MWYTGYCGILALFAHVVQHFGFAVHSVFCEVGRLVLHFLFLNCLFFCTCCGLCPFLKMVLQLFGYSWAFLLYFWFQFGVLLDLSEGGHLLVFYGALVCLLVFMLFKPG